MREPYESYFHHLRELHNMIKRAAEGLPAEGLDWAPAPETNSLAVLMVHVAGAERHWIGEIVGRQPIDRNRSAEVETAGLCHAMLWARSAGGPGLGTPCPAWYEAPRL